MENTILKFKTSLNCSGCVSKIQTDLDNHKAIADWHVDTDNPDKILTVNAAGISAEEIAEIVRKKGFTAELLQ